MNSIFDFYLVPYGLKERNSIVALTCFVLLHFCCYKRNTKFLMSMPELFCSLVAHIYKLIFLSTSSSSGIMKTSFNCTFSKTRIRSFCC